MKTKAKNTNKSDIKKKIDHLEIKPEKIRMTPSKQKQPLKAELISQLKTLEEENILLRNKNLEMGKTIELLENEVALLMKETKSVKLESISTQTVRMLSCHSCNYKTDDVYELDAHRWMEHEDDEPDTSIHNVKQNQLEKIPTQFNCNFCTKTFSTKANLMKHKKQDHKDKVATCWRFIAGDCHFSDNNCWFNHCNNKLEEMDEIECNWCEKIFMTQPEFLNHRKKEHIEYVPQCRNVTCTYNVFCWFIHEQYENENNINENQEVFEKIGIMEKKMEKMTQHLVEIENDD